jgi:hypothetical protein
LDDGTFNMKADWLVTVIWLILYGIGPKQVYMYIHVLKKRPTKNLITIGVTDVSRHVSKSMEFSMTGVR